MRRIPGVLFLLGILPGLATAATPPPPLTSDAYEFPGAVPSPGSAASAGVGLSDRWLGDEPFDNPAVPPRRVGVLSPLLYHMSRQDLRGFNRSYSEQSAFFDGAGAWFGGKAGGLGYFLYGHQPVLRLEENAYLTGPQSGSPAPVENSTSTREMHGGAGVSWAMGIVRFGLAGEWTYRDDSYRTVDRSGSPLSGSSEVSFSGSAIGGQAGARAELGPEGAGHLTVGAAVRFVPELEVEGDQVANLVSGNSSGPVRATRESGIESGMSARWSASPQIRLLAGVGLRTSQEWQGFGVTRGSGGSWGIGLDFHDSRDPWTLRIGGGETSERGVREPRNGIFGLGFGWIMESTTLDLSAVRHSFSHLGAATSYDDRVLASVTLAY